MFLGIVLMLPKNAVTVNGEILFFSFVVKQSDAIKRYSTWRQSEIIAFMFLGIMLMLPKNAAAVIPVKGFSVSI